MGRPIIVDDGGSIRIKVDPQNTNLDGQMDDLFNVDPSGHSEHDLDLAYGDYNDVQIFWLDVNGDLKRTNPEIIQFDKVKITTDTGVKIEFNKKSGSNPKDKISLDGHPNLRSSQNNNQRSYSIINGGRITRIDVHPGGINVRDLVPDFTYFAAVIR